MKTLYLLSPKISWKNFKMLINKLVKQEGIVAVHLDKVIWTLNKDHKLYCGFLSEMKDDMWVGLDIPKGYKIVVIK